MIDIYNAQITRMKDLRSECMEQQISQKVKVKKSRKPHIFRNVFTNKHQGKLA